jgi:hypothetical protein
MHRTTILAAATALLMPLAAHAGDIPGWHEPGDHAGT